MVILLGLESRLWPERGCRAWGGRAGTGSSCLGDWSQQLPLLLPSSGEQRGFGARAARGVGSSVQWSCWDSLGPQSCAGGACRLEPPCARRQNLTAPYCSQLGHAPGMTCQAGPVDRTLPAERFLKPLKQVVQAALNGHFLETAFTVFASHESFLDVRIVLWELNCLGP